MREEVGSTKSRGERSGEDLCTNQAALSKRCRNSGSLARPNIDLLTSLFHLPVAIAVTSVHPSASELVIGVVSQATNMPCPECHQLSARIHGHYQRTVADLPCAGRTVILALTARSAAWHGGMHAVLSGFVGGGGYDAAPIGRPANDDRLAAVFGVIPLLDAGVEGVQVDMQDRSCSFVYVPSGLSAVFHPFSSIVPASRVIEQRTMLQIRCSILRNRA